MAHQVQAGNARPKIQSPIGTWFLGVITGGLYTIYWWYRTTRDLAAFESSDGSVSPIKPGLEAGAIGGTLLGTVLVWATMSETVMTTDINGQPMESRQLSDAGSILTFVLVVAMWVFGARLRSHAKRVMTRAGMLPEEQVGGFKFWLVNIIFAAPGASSSVQQDLNVLWGRYPRWYSSIGGTKEEVLTAGAPTGVVMPSSGPAPTQVPAPVPMPAPVAAAPSADAAAVMQELGPRAQAGQLNAVEGFRYAEAVDQVHGAEAAAPWYEFVANTDSSNAKAMYRTGAWRVGRGDASGMQYLHRAAQDPAFRAPAANAMAEYLEQSGRAAEAAQWRTYAA